MDETKNEKPYDPNPNTGDDQTEGNTGNEGSTESTDAATGASDSEGSDTEK